MVCWVGVHPHLANGERPESRPPEEFEPGARRGGWQHEAASRTEQRDSETRICSPGWMALDRRFSGPRADLEQVSL